VTLAPERGDTVSSQQSGPPPVPKSNLSLFPNGELPKRAASLLKHRDHPPAAEKEVVQSGAAPAYAEIDISSGSITPETAMLISPMLQPLSSGDSVVSRPGTALNNYPDPAAEIKSPIQVSSQELKSRSNSLAPDTASILSNPASTMSNEVIDVDFTQLIPTVAYTGSSLPLRYEDSGLRLRQARDEILSSRDRMQHLAWAEDVFRHSTTVENWIKRMEKGNCRVAPSSAITADLRFDARKIVDNLASDQYPKALVVKARWFGLEEHETQQLYLSALSRGQNRAAFYLGKIYESKKDIKTAYEYYRKGAYEQDSACSYVS
jgi:hypothetical protein